MRKRVSGRRKNPYPYGSAEWRAYLQENAAEYSGNDRRTVIRRMEDQSQEVVEPIASKNAYRRILLEPAERKLIEDLYLIDLE